MNAALSPMYAPLDPDDRSLSESIQNESWEYLDADTQHLTHNIHRYSGKFIPQIAARAIALLTRPGETVLDPYCGSGTTLLEAALIGRRAIGFDLNPLAVLIARTKVTPVPPEFLSSLRRQLTQVLSDIELQEDMPLFHDRRHTSKFKSEVLSDVRMNDPWFRKWFTPAILEDLVAIDRSISRISDSRCRDVARVAFSDILRKSSNAHSGYPNVMFHRAAPERARPIKPFLKSLDRVCQMIAALESVDARWKEVNVKIGNATSLPLENCSVDAIVSHPPYIGSIPYAEYGVLSLKWLGRDPKALDYELTGGRRQSADVVERFHESYAGMLKEGFRVLRPGRHIFLMVGNPIVKGKGVDLAKMTIDLAGQAGFRLTARTERNGVNRRANKMGSEHLLFFGKPRSIRQVTG